MIAMNPDRMPSMPPLALRPSRKLAVLLLAAHAATGCMLLWLPLPPWLRGGAALLLLGSAVHTVMRHALLRGPRAITALAFTDSEQVSIGRRDGSWQAGRILGSSTVGALLTVLNIAASGRTAHVVLLGDSLPADDFRRMRIWLRWGSRGDAEDVAVE